MTVLDWMMRDAEREGILVLIYESRGSIVLSLGWRTRVILHELPREPGYDRARISAIEISEEIAALMFGERREELSPDARDFSIWIAARVMFEVWPVMKELIRPWDSRRFVFGMPRQEKRGEPIDG